MVDEKTIDAQISVLDTETLAKLVKGFALISAHMGMSDILGLMRGQLSADDTADIKEAQTMLATLDFLQNAGIDTSEPNLDALFEPEFKSQSAA